MMYVGMDMIRTSAVRRQEKRLHTESLEELSESFEDEVAPMVVEVQGTQHRLTGTAEAQYAEWRDLLQRLFISETGFAPESIEVFADRFGVAPDRQSGFARSGTARGAARRRRASASVRGIGAHERVHDPAA
jgi:hypothetical protein